MGEPAAQPEEPEGRFAGRQPTLVVLVGPPGTGQSHLARELAARVPLRIVETDDIRRRVARGQPDYSEKENARVYFTAHRELERLLRSGENVAFDATNIYRSGRKKLYRIADRAGARVLIVRTEAPDSEIARRLERRRAGMNPLDRSEADWEVYARMKAELQEVTRPHLVVDTSHDLEPALATMARFIGGPESPES